MRLDLTREYVLDVPIEAPIETNHDEKGRNLPFQFPCMTCFGKPVFKFICKVFHANIAGRKMALYLHTSKET